MYPTIFIIFGITGDLAQRKLIPALLSLYVKKQLPRKFAIIGFSRRHFTREDFRQYIRDNMGVKPGQYREEEIKHFLDYASYEQGFFDTQESYKSLAAKLKSIDDSWGQCSNKLFHLAASPDFYETILDSMAQNGLSVPCAGEGEGWTRILIEKPFGTDTDTAKKLDKKLAVLFDEDQIFRIDHYLAKESIQNILTFRFSNPMFEALWNNRHIEKVHIKLMEKVGAEGRGAFYDSFGALKDVGQNHILQMLALIAMEKPKSFNALGIRKERAKIVSRIRQIPKKQLTSVTVRGQYDGYLREEGVKANSATETYFRIESYVDTARWKNVPFYLESGKGLFESKSEIDIYFKGEKGGKNGGDERGNILTFRIQPDDGIKIRFWLKKPGYSGNFSMESEAKTLKFLYSDVPALAKLPDAYERVFHDAIEGDQTLFTSSDEVVAAWKFITPIAENWKDIPLTIYKRGAKEI
jgi:glucose-6-phosphate 1-dehydrogenase